MEPARIALAVDPLVAMIRAPSSECFRITSHTASVRLPGLSRIASGTVSLPMSWKRAAYPSVSSSAAESPSSRPIASTRSQTRREWPAVYASRLSTMLERLAIAEVDRSLSSLLTRSSDTFCVWIISAAWRRFCAFLRACVTIASCVLRIASSVAANATSA